MLLQVKELEDGVLQLLATYEDCTHLSTAIQSVGNGYQLREEVPWNFFFTVGNNIHLFFLDFVKLDLHFSYL